MKNERKFWQCYSCGSARLTYSVCSDCGTSQGGRYTKEIERLEKREKRLEEALIEVRKSLPPDPNLDAPWSPAIAIIDEALADDAAGWGVGWAPLDPASRDTRPQRGGWAPGTYYCVCKTGCGRHFIGDKRAVTCADCAYEDVGETQGEAAGGWEHDGLPSAGELAESISKHADAPPQQRDALDESHVTVTRALTYLGYLLNSALCGGYEPHQNLYQYHQAVRSILVKLQEDEYYTPPQQRDALEALEEVEVVLRSVAGHSDQPMMAQAANDALNRCSGIRCALAQSGEGRGLLREIYDCGGYVITGHGRLI